MAGINDGQAQNKAPTARRNKKEGQSFFNSNQHQFTGLPSRRVGNQSLGGSGEVEQRQEFEDKPRRYITGGILRQLIEETKDQLASLELQREKLTNRLNQLCTLYEQLQEQREDEEIWSSDLQQ